MKRRDLEQVKIGKRGDGSLVRFPDSQNWVSVYSHNGQEHRESTGTPDLKAAKRVHKQTLDRLAADRMGLQKYIPPTAAKVTVGEILDAYDTDLGLRGLKSAAATRYHLKPVRERFGAMRALAVTPKVVDQYVSTLKAAGKANATVNRRLQTLAAAFKLAVAQGALTSVPHIRKLSEAGNERRDFFDREMVDRLLPHLPEYLRDPFRFALLVGWRSGEVKALRWDWVDREARTIVLPDSKNGEGRVLAITGDLVAIFDRAEADRLVVGTDGEPHISEYVFHRKGQPLGDFKRSWTSARIKAGLARYIINPVTKKKRLESDVIFHATRRTAARNLIRAKVSRDVAKSVTGHKTDSMFSRYNITDTRDVARAIEAVSKRGE